MAGNHELELNPAWGEEVAFKAYLSRVPSMVDDHRNTFGSTRRVSGDPEIVFFLCCFFCFFFFAPIFVFKQVTNVISDRFYEVLDMTS